MDTTTDATSALEILLSLDDVGLLQDETNEGSGKLVLNTSYVLTINIHDCKQSLPPMAIL